MIFNVKPIIVFLLAFVFLGGCENAKKQFDLSNRAPDEFAVITRAPLEMPPDFTLPTPEPGAPRPQEISTVQKARAAVVGEVLNRQITEKNIGEGESLLLRKSGAADASPNIRQVVDKETAEIAEEEMPGIDHLRRWVGKPVEPPAKVVDPVKEIERIRANRGAGNSGQSDSEEQSKN